jgi:hypothetical protein
VDGGCAQGGTLMRYGPFADGCSGGCFVDGWLVVVGFL